MQPIMHTFGAILPFNNESEDIKEGFDNGIRKSITDVQQSWLDDYCLKSPVFENSSLNDLRGNLVQLTLFPSGL